MGRAVVIHGEGWRIPPGCGDLVAAECFLEEARAEVALDTPRARVVLRLRLTSGGGGDGWGRGAETW